MFCENCGAQLKEGAKFCPKCGAKVPENTVPIQPVPNNAPVTPQPEIYAAQGMAPQSETFSAQSAQNPYGAPSQPPKKKRTGMILFAAFAVIAVAAFAFFAFGGKTINLNDYATISVNGTDGNGKAVFDLDDEFMYLYEDKIEYSRSFRKMVEGITEEEIAEYLLESQHNSDLYNDPEHMFAMFVAISECDADKVADAYNDIVGYRYINGSTLKMIFENMIPSGLGPAQFMALCIPGGSFDKRTELSNGDVITFTWDQDDDYKLMKDCFNYTFKYSNIKYTVTGLEEDLTADTVQEEAAVAFADAGSVISETESETAAIQAEIQTEPEPETEPEETASTEPAPRASNDHIISITATSTLAENGTVYSTDLLIDGDATTAWSEGVTGNGEGESVTITFDDVYTVSVIGIFPGYQKSEELFYKNSRPAEIVLSFPDSEDVIFDLDDVCAGTLLHLVDPIETDSVTITIYSVYEGNTYQDTLISEITFMDM